MQQTSLQKNHRASCLISIQGDFPPHSAQKTFFIKDWISGQIEQFGYNPTASFLGLKSTKNEVISTLEIVPESSPKKNPAVIEGNYNISALKALLCFCEEFGL